jgi:hypothetical protein
MEKKFRSIIDELSNYSPVNNKDLFIESRAQQLIASAKHLIGLLETTFPAEVSEDLTKRLLLAIKNDDPEKFSRKMRQLREGKK